MILSGQVGGLYSNEKTKQDNQIGGVFDWSLSTDGYEENTFDGTQISSELICTATSYFFNKRIITEFWVRLFGFTDDGAIDGIIARAKLKGTPNTELNRWIKQPLEFFLESFTYHENAIEQ